MAKIKPNKERYTLTAEVDKELKQAVIDYANVETDGKESPAIRKILREYLFNRKKKKAS